MSLSICPVDFVSINGEQSLQERNFLTDPLLSQRGEGQISIDEEKNRDELLLLLLQIKNLDFVSHEDPHEQIRVACSLVQLLNVLPFQSFGWKEEDFVIIFNFILKQLKHFDTSDRNIFKNCVSLLKNLTKTRIFIELFLCLKNATKKENIYNAVLLTLDMSSCIQRATEDAEYYLVQLLQNFINETKHTSTKGGGIILSYIIQENKTKHPAMYKVAVQVLRNCLVTLKLPIKMLLWQGILEDGIPLTSRIRGHEFEVMFELQHICPSILFGVWDQFESFMSGSFDGSYSVDSSKKKKMALELLVLMFSEKNSDFVLQHRSLWNCFKYCVNHSSFVRLLLVGATPQFVVNQPDLFQEIIHILEDISLDSNPENRCCVLKAINKATKLNLNVLQHSTLLDILKRGIYDKNENVLEQAVTTLGLIYRRITGGEYPSLMKEAEWLANTLMHLYVAPYDVNINIPRIEKVIVRCLVPLELPPDQRMKRLLQLWCLFDDESRSNFHHLQELKKRAYENVLQLLSLYQEPSADKLSSDQLVWMRAMLAGKIAVTMGCQKDVHQRLLLLTEELVENRNLLNFLQEYVTEDNSIEDRNSLWSENKDKMFSYTSQTKKRSRILKQKVMEKGSEALAVRKLCAKVHSVLVDEAALKELLKLVISCVTSSDKPEDLHLAGSMTGKLAVELLHEYFYLMPYLAFQDESIVDQLLLLLRVQNGQYSLPAMKIFVALSAFKPLSEVFPEFVSHQLRPLWQHLATSGTPAEVKLAFRCLCSHINDPVIIYNILTECMKELDTAGEHYLTRAVAVGQFATHLPRYTDTTCILYISNLCCQLVGRFVLEDLEDERDDVAEWHEKDCLPYKTKCRVMALKALTQLTIRLCNPEVTEKTLTVLSKIIANGGAYRNTHSLSAATKARLRLTAGCSFLKICGVTRIYAGQVRGIHFFKMAKLMTDESEFVRREFVEKLHERLMQWKQQKYHLPTTFISYFVLAGLEKDEDVKSSMLHALNLCVQDKRHHMWSLINITREFKNTAHLLTCCQQIVPEFCVQTALQLVAEYVFDFTDETSVCRAYSCLSFLFNSLLGSRNGFGCLATAFHFKLFGLMKCGRNAITPKDEELTKKIWATCEIGEYLLSTVNPKVDNDGEVPDPIIEERYHKIDPNTDNRGIHYLTANMETLLKNKRVSPRLSDVFHPNRRKRSMQQQGISRTESLQVTSDIEAPPRNKKQKKAPPRTKEQKEVPPRTKEQKEAPARTKKQKKKK